MYQDHTVGVVVPAYNEEGLIGDVIETVPDYVDAIYVIDDCSSDETWNEIIKAARRDKGLTKAGKQDDESVPKLTDGAGLLAQRTEIHEQIGRVIPLQHRENKGAGGATKTGYLAALEDEPDIIVTMDGDGQMDPDYMPRLLDPIVEDEADYAKANRLLYREYREEMPAFRFLGNSVLTFLTKIASGYWKTMDPQNGYTAISHYALNNVGIETLYEYYGYCNDLLVKLNAKGMRVADVAVPAVYRDEESSINYIEFVWKVSGMLLKNFLWRLKVKHLVLDFHPLALFYLFGFVTTIFGVLGLAWSLYTKFQFGNTLFVRASTSILVFTVGSMFIMFAMLFDMQVNESKEVQIRK